MKDEQYDNADGMNPLRTQAARGSVQQVRHRDPFDDASPWGAHRPAGWGAFWLRVARGMPGGWPWSRLALVARRAARRLLAGPVDTRLWGHRLRLHPDRSVSEARILFLPRAWDRIERKHLGRWMKPGSTFVDVGANVGAYSYWILSRIGRAGRVVAVEPDPDLARQLRYNVGVNRLGGRMRVVEAAVGAVGGTGGFAPGVRNSGEGRLVAVGGGLELDEDWIPVRVVTLAEVVRDAGIDRIDCLKVDVEGREAEVVQPFLRDAPRASWPRLLLVEMKTAEAGERRQSEALRAWLVDRGYRLALQTKLNGLFRLE